VASPPMNSISAANRHLLPKDFEYFMRLIELATEVDKEGWLEVVYFHYRVHLPLDNIYVT